MAVCTGKMEGRGNAAMTEKWGDERGETLIEVVASVLIMTLAVLLLFSAGMVSVRFNKEARNLDEKFYSALNAAEAQSTIAPDSIVPAGSSKVTVEQTLPVPAEAPVEVDVGFYGGEGVLSYKYSP